MKFLAIISGLVFAGWLGISAYAAFLMMDPAELCEHWRARLAQAQVNHAINPSLQGSRVTLRNAQAAATSNCSSTALHGR